MPSLRSTNPALTAATLSVASLAGLIGTLYYLDIPSLLSQRVASRQIPSRSYASPSSNNKKDAPSLAAFQVVTSQLTLPSTYPLAVAIEKNIPIYDCALLDVRDERLMERIEDEWAHILLYGPGVYILKRFFAGESGKRTLNEANTTFDSIIAQEQAQSSQTTNGTTNSGDHFAPPSANTRVWNSLSKHGLASPRNFYTYYSNPLWPHICTAHLGPSYRLTTQLNIVRPGGQAQTCHRDYHLGFQTVEETAKYPKALHAASALLTLQGAVVHTDMPLESGPTRFLPFSQQFDEGYMAYRREEFAMYFNENYVSLAMEQGDAVFFSPAIFHAAGENQTADVQRSANLVQVSAAFGKTMESVDALPLVEAGWDVVSEEVEKTGGLSEEVDAWVQAVGEGYPFPTNLDRRPPAPEGGGMAPESEQGLFRRGLREKWGVERVVRELKEMREASAA